MIVKKNLLLFFLVICKNLLYIYILLMYYIYVYVLYYYFNFNKVFRVSLVIFILNIFMKYFE